MQQERIDKITYGLLLAHVASLRSEDPFRKVGAVAMDHNHRVLATGYNGLPSGIDKGSDFWNDRDKRRPYCLHAEINCLSLIKREQCFSLFITHAPCISCAQAIAAHQISFVHYMHNYETDNNASRDILLMYGIALYKHKFEDVVKHIYPKNDIQGDTGKPCC